MELQTVETVVRRLFSDDDFRARAKADSAAALSEYDLGAHERSALVRLCERLDQDQASAGPQLFWF